MRSVVDQDVCVAQDEAHAQYRGMKLDKKKYMSGAKPNKQAVTIHSLQAKLEAQDKEIKKMKDQQVLNTTGNTRGNRGGGNRAAHGAWWRLRRPLAGAVRLGHHFVWRGLFVCRVEWHRAFGSSASTTICNNLCRACSTKSSIITRSCGG